jgi:hypothetical protein
MFNLWLVKYYQGLYLKRIFWAYGVTVNFNLLWAAIKLEI